MRPRPMASGSSDPSVGKSLFGRAGTSRPNAPRANILSAVRGTRSNTLRLEFLRGGGAFAEQRYMNGRWRGGRSVTKSLLVLDERQQRVDCTLTGPNAEQPE